MPNVFVIIAIVVALVVAMVSIPQAWIRFQVGYETRKWGIPMVYDPIGRSCLPQLQYQRDALALRRT